MPVFGRRERDLRHGFLLPRAALGNFSYYANTPEALQTVLAGMHDARLSWRDIAWLKSISPLPLVLKGILTPEDARLAVEHGASAIFVSNHGGRQLDRVQATIDVLEEIVAAVSGRLEVYLDGGVRRGVDVVTALALGADAVFIGRPYLYALAADGEEGVSRALWMLYDETANAMALLGAPTLEDIRRDHIRRRPSDY